jgi:hypothetical protein
MHEPERSGVTQREPSRPERRPRIMRPVNRQALGAILTAASIVAALTACAAAGPPPTPGQAPKQRAEADAAAILTSFVVPPGGRRLARPPKLPGDLLASPESILVSTSAVDKVTFWEAPGQPRAVLAWEQARLLPRFTLGDADFGPPAWDRGYELAPAGGLTDRQLVVEVASVGGGQTAIRVDAQVGWQPPRQRSEVVPSAARYVTITELPGLTVKRHVPAPVTIADPAKVRRLAALINGFPLSTFPAGAPCPARLGDGLRLTFRAKAGGAALATALTGQACADDIIFTVNGKPGLDLTGSSSLNDQVLAITGLPWKLS